MLSVLFIHHLLLDYMLRYIIRVVKTILCQSIIWSVTDLYARKKSVGRTAPTDFHLPKSKYSAGRSDTTGCLRNCKFILTVFEQI